MDSQIDISEKQEKTILSQLMSIIGPFILGVVIFYFLVRDTNFAELWNVIKRANWLILLSSLIFGLLANTLKAFRWRFLMKTLDYQPTLRSTIYTTWGSFAVNYLIPRAGEVWKCGALSRNQHIPFSKTFGTAVIDRIFDVIILGLICIFAFLMNLDFFVVELSKNKSLFDEILHLLESPWLYLSFFFLILLIYIVFKFFSNSRPISKMKSFFREIIKDLKAIWHMKDKVWIIIYTVCAWVLYFADFYIAFFAFEFTKDLGIMVGLIAFALSSLSLIIPTQGGLGPWQVAVVATLTLYNVDYVSATAFATGVFAIHSIWLIVCGIYGVMMLNVSTSQTKKRKTVKM